jgi:hypothetical protein
MVIPEQFRKCVVFLFADLRDSETGESREPVGTAFIVGIPAAPPLHAEPSPLRENEGWFVHYLVTARHMVTLSRKYGSLFARIHLEDGTAPFIELPTNSWHEHATTEVAASLLRVPIPLDQTTIPIEAFELDAKVAEHVISLGDEVFFMGLFSEHPGAGRNQPIVRFGNIALMPGEKVLVDTGDSMARIRAYLIEARSSGGHSGSPAFIYFPPDRFGNSITVSATLPIFFLGLVQGHYDVESETKLLGDVGKVKVNAGIATVVPAQEIYDLLMSDEVIAERKGAGTRTT